MSEVRSILKETARYSASQYIAQAAGVVVAVATRRFMGPELIGVWNTLQIGMAYSTYVTLGCSKAVNREYPMCRASGNLAQADFLKNLGFTFTILMSLIPAILVLVSAFFLRGKVRSEFVWGLVLLAVLIVFQRAYDYCVMLLRTSKSFKTASELTVFGAGVNLILTLILVREFKLYGLYATVFLNVILGFAFIRAREKMSLRWVWNSSEVRRIVASGVALMAMAFSLETLRSVDRMLIARYLGMTEMGHYSIAVMAHGYLYTLPSMLGTVMYPSMIEKIGKSGRIADLRNYLVGPVRSLILFMGCAVGVAICVLPDLMRILLPRFEPGIPALKAVLFSTYAMALGNVPTFVLIAADRQKAATIATLGVAGIFFASGAFVLSRGGGLVQIAALSAFAWLFHTLILTLIAYRRTGSLAGLTGLSVSVLSGAAGVGMLTRSVEGLSQSLGYPVSLFGTAIFLIVYLPCAFWMAKKWGIWSDLRKIIKIEFWRPPTAKESS